MNTTNTATKTNARKGNGTSVHATYLIVNDDNTGTLSATVCGQSIDRTGLSFRVTADAVTCKRCLKAMAV